MGKTTLLVMAAGLGSRYGGDKQIDGMGPHGEILMQYSIYDAIRAGFDKILFVVKPEHEDIVKRFCEDIAGVEIGFVHQDFSSIPDTYAVPADRVRPFGTVHAVLCAKDKLHEPFAVINADDYYGIEAYVQIYSRLHTLKKGEASMVAYRLINTLKPNSPLTRGVCKIENGRLISVTETYKITLGENGEISDVTTGILTPDAPVSMNMWGFLPDIFLPLEREFKAFLGGIQDGDIRAEYPLPVFVDKLISRGELTVYADRTFTLVRRHISRGQG